MIRRLFRVLFGGWGCSMPVVDECGTSYRAELLKGLLRVHDSLERHPDAAHLRTLHGLLKDFRDFEYGADRSEAAELRAALEKLELRLKILEVRLGDRRFEPVVARKIAP